MKPIGRREFVLLGAGAAGAAGATGAGLVLGLAPSPVAAATGAAAKPNVPTVLAQPFLRIAADGRVTVIAKHLEMGQGIWTGLAAIVAEELDADWSMVEVEGAPVDPALYKNLIFGFQTTGGSTSIANSWEQLRRAGATARALLVAAAAQRWQVPEAEVTVSDGVLRHASGRQAGFGTLAALAATLPLPAQPVLKDPARFKLLGKPIARLHAPQMVSGQPLYAIDMRRSGMKLAMLQRSPRFGGVPKTVDDTAARAVRGVLEVLRLPSAVAVIADNTWAALQGRRALKIEWDDSAAETRSSSELATLFKALAHSGQGIVCTQRGDAPAALGRAAKVIEADFELPYLAHAPMEPLCVLGELRDGRCELWGGFQNPSADHAAACKLLGLPADRVLLHTLHAGGSFGRRATFVADWVSEMALLLKASEGRWPLKLLWTREDDLGGGYYRPLNHHHVRAGIDAAGRLLGIDETIAAQSFLFPPPAGDLVTPARADPLVFEGSLALRYEVADARVRWVYPKVGVPVQMFRALGHNHCTFVKEVLMDEMARAAGQDELAFRLAHLPADSRQAAVLRLAAEKAGWGRPLPPGHALGIGVQESQRSFVAQIAQVQLVDGVPRIERVVCAVDCGRVLNPGIVRAQMEGGIAFGLDVVLHNRVTLHEGRPAQSNFHDHPVLRMHAMPSHIDIHLIDSEQPPTGVGEPGSVPIVPAVANAVARLTGQPVRTLPLVRS